MHQGQTVFCFQVYSRNRTVILYVLANWALALTFEIPSEAPLCFPSVQKFATVHFPVSKMLERDVASEPVVFSLSEPGLRITRTQKYVKIFLFSLWPHFKSCIVIFKPGSEIILIFLSFFQQNQGKICPPPRQSDVLVST